jgi:STE24 endopeptidase
LLRQSKDTTEPSLVAATEAVVELCGDVYFRTVMNAFTWVFLGMLGTVTATQLWLAKRQIEHVCNNRDTVPEMFAQAVPLPSHQKAADYSVAKAKLEMGEILVGAFSLLVLTLGGLLNWLDSTWEHVLAQGTLAHGVALCASVVVLLAAVDLPISIYRVFGLEARFGFNRMTPRLFIVDLLKKAVLAASFGIPLLLLILWLMGVMGKLWWLYVWLVWMAFNLLILFLFPTFIAPLFNRFTPLDDPDLAGRIENLLRRCGFGSRRLYVMDGSKRSSHGNAYFTGFGPAKRIVFFDTLLARLAASEVEAVLAHELGHHKLRHIWKRAALLFATSLLLLWGLGQLIDKPWFYQGLGVSRGSPAVALILFMLIVPVFTFFLQPLSSRFSRGHEFEADAYSAAHASSADLKTALVKLYKDNATTLTPDTLHSAFYDSHPPAVARIKRLISPKSG